MRHLAGGVNAGIGAAGAAQGNLLAAEFLDRLLESMLNSRVVGLVLPAGEKAAVIFDVEAKTRHSS